MVYNGLSLPLTSPLGESFHFLISYYFLTIHFLLVMWYFFVTQYSLLHEFFVLCKDIIFFGDLHLNL